MTRALLAALLALAILSACATPLTFRVDPRFEVAENAGLLRAATAWNARSTRRISFDARGAWRILKEEPPLSAADDDDDPRTPDREINGQCRRSTRTIWIHPLSGEDEYTVALHEFGHALGLGHTTTGVMMAFTVSVEFTPEVLAECRKVKACR